MTIIETLTRTRELLLAFGDIREADVALARILGDVEPGELGVSDARRKAAAEELRRCEAVASAAIRMTLSGRERLVVECFYLRARSVPSIAMGLKMRDGSVKRIKREALKKLEAAERESAE